MSMFGADVQSLALHPFGGWLVFVLLALLSVGLAGWAYWATPAPLTRGRRILLWVCRGVALVGVLVLLARPVAVVAESLRGKPEVMLLVDRSGSMTLPDGDVSRSDRARAVADELAQELGGRFNVTYRPFDDHLRPAASGDTELVADSLRATAPGDAVARLVREPRDGPLAGVVLITDGATTRGRDLPSAVGQLDVPLHAVVVGDSTAGADLQLVGLDVPPAAFVGEPVEVAVRARSTSEGPRTTTLVLQDGEREIAREEVTLGGDGAVSDVRFTFTPDEPGQRFYRARFLDEESATDNTVSINDEIHLPLLVRKDRLQVLVIEEHLSWDFTFLRHTLERDTTLAYSYLVKLGDDVKALGDARVERFPRDLPTLNEFKAVVLGDVDRDVLGEPELDLLARYVEGGGGLLVLGGNRAVGMGRLAGTPLERVIPLPLRSPPTAGEGSVAAPRLPARLSLLGETHPLVTLHADTYTNRALWADLPPLRPAIAAASGGPGAEVLVELEGAGRRFPLITVGRTGAGRVLAVTGRAIWQWKFLREGVGADDDFFDRFWVGAVRWLADPEPTARIRIGPERWVFRPGDEVILSGRVLGPDLTPARDATIDADLTGTDGTTHPLVIERGEAGEVRLVAQDLPAGAYDYAITVTERGAPPVELSGRFQVERNGPEWWVLEAQPAVLRQAAAETGGSVVTADRVRELASRINPPPVTRASTHEVALWNHPLPFVLFLLAVAIEWWLRRRSGMA
jgi:uncharacterized membrane protein